MWRRNSKAFTITVNNAVFLWTRRGIYASRASLPETPGEIKVRVSYPVQHCLRLSELWRTLWRVMILKTNHCSSIYETLMTILIIYSSVSEGPTEKKSIRVLHKVGSTIWKSEIIVPFDLAFRSILLWEAALSIYGATKVSNFTNQSATADTVCGMVGKLVRNSSRTQFDPSWIIW